MQNLIDPQTACDVAAPAGAPRGGGGMSEHGLAKFAAFLANERDRYWALYAEFGDRADLRSAKANAMALCALWTATNGEHGQLLDEQPGGGWS